ncbi:MAG: isoprenyl transferase [Ruminococcaceae bacterium]|nr:isoprenyl transferase [Oscillospiraceae bacterium]
MFFKKKKEQTIEKIDPNNLPLHIGVIMDGNGRWAAKRHLPRSAGHRAGADTFEKIVKYCDKIGIKAITAYAFSTENWNRPKAEVDNLMNLLYNYLLMAEEKFAGTNVILRVIGDRSALSDKINEAIDHAIGVTDGNTGIVLNMALNYGGRDEIVRATRIAAENVKNGMISPDEIDGEYLDKLMYTADNPPVDLIIRPSGEKRLSNFLLWQAAYAEFWYSDINWPDFSEKDMERAIIDYQKRNRRFGKV